MVVADISRPSARDAHTASPRLGHRRRSHQRGDRHLCPPSPPGRHVRVGQVRNDLRGVVRHVFLLRRIAIDELLRRSGRAQTAQCIGGPKAGAVLRRGAPLRPSARPHLQLPGRGDVGEPHRDGLRGLLVHGGASGDLLALPEPPDRGRGRRHRGRSGPCGELGPRRRRAVCPPRPRLASAAADRRILEALLGQSPEARHMSSRAGDQPKIKSRRCCDGLQ
mmetsp:Transcript_69350/g.201150  ORF Transcript_69350/g.201150 Transcript_69350/m.201150 type:complete len:221 (-) Transcript_69350:43-705(-)